MKHSLYFTGSRDPLACPEKQDYVPTVLLGVTITL